MGDVLWLIQTIGHFPFFQHEPTDLSWWGDLAISLIAFIPVIGALKYADQVVEIATRLKRPCYNGTQEGV